MTPLLRRLARASVAALAGGFFCFGALQAQTPALRGRVLDAAGEPVTGATVVLHHVTESAGGEVGRTTSGPDGSFELRFDAGGRSGLYFAATRYEGALYVGVPFRDPAEAGPDYRIIVGENPAGVTAGSAAGDGPADPLPWLVGALLGIVAVGVVLRPVLARRRGAYAVRSLLAELAVLEERHAEREAELAPEVRAAYHARRERLRARLRELSQPPASYAADQH